jgi:hypothetical protein
MSSARRLCRCSLSRMNTAANCTRRWQSTSYHRAAAHLDVLTSLPPLDINYLIKRTAGAAGGSGRVGVIHIRPNWVGPEWAWWVWRAGSIAVVTIGSVRLQGAEDVL